MYAQLQREGILEPSSRRSGALRDELKGLAAKAGAL
jgi:hypothetical protein